MAKTFQSGFETTLAKRVDPADTIRTLATVPTVTTGRMYLDNWEQKEWIKFTGVSGGTITGVVRWLSQTADPATSGTWLTWIAGTKIKLVAMHDQMVDKLEWDAVIISATVYDTTAARNTALWANGVATKAYTNVYVTATWLFYNYNLSTAQWESVDAGTVTPNANDTVAGKVEIATQAEFDAWTATWWTWASVVATNDQIRKQINTATAKTTPVNADSIGIADSAASGVIKKTTLTQLKAAGDMQATTTTSWFVELATDAEATTGTDQTRYINSKQLWLKNKTFITNITRAMNAASWSVVVAHWLWFTPKYITATAVNNWWSKARSEWSSDFTTHRCNSDAYNGNWSTITNTVTQQNALIYIKDTNSSWTDFFRIQSCTVTADATNITFVWTYTDSWSSLATPVMINILAVL